MTGFVRTEVALLPVDILRQAGINFAFRFRREDIKQVIFNNPATVIFWSDGTKTVVKCSENDTFNPEVGLAMAICKKAFGNTGAYNDIFKKWVPETGVDAMRDPGCRCGRGAFFTCPKGDSGYKTDKEIVDAYNRVFRNER